MNNEPTQEQIEQVLLKNLDVKILDIRRITEGYTHYMYDCKCELTHGEIKHYILRISYNRKEDTDLAKELAVMELYSKHGVPTPIVYASDVERKDFEFDYAIIQKFEGVPLASILESLSPVEKKNIAEKIGQLLKKIHSISMDDYGDFTKHGLKKREEFTFRKLEGAPIMHSWTRTLLKGAFEDLSGLVTLDLITVEQSHQLMTYLYSCKELIKDAKPVLIHGDFHADHILMQKIEGEWEITGIVDFEFAASMAIEYDFIKLHRSGLLEDKSFREGLFEGYGEENIHTKFDELVQFYRVLRDLGFAFHLAKAGDKETYNKVMDKVWKMIAV
jgi:aminoglycoside phosphotransferase (APT) family kinase protein